jgi:hypothetical protein
MKRTSKGSGRKKTSVEEKLSKIKFDLEKVEKIAAFYGSTDEQLASVLGVTEKTINRWKQSKTFLSALKKGKDLANTRVVESLYARATGYNHKAVKIFMPAGAKKPVYAPYIEHCPPDPTSMIFFLKNRDKDNWKDRHDIGSSDGTLVLQVGLPAKDPE